ncbi:MAG: hypothetical protein DRQ55_00465 [Planctomycetota bacterium]|nr:MAG: hypothetical protein DRQ55_00465 [Planctomycetota bacterium]
MTRGLRSIAFVTELVHLPVRHNPKSLQRMHSALFDRPGCSYRDFKLVPGGAQLSNAVPGMPGQPVSLVNLAADRVQIREEQTGVSKDEFAERLTALAQCALETLPVQLFMVQQFAVRSVVNPQAGEDARQFMLQTVAGFDEGLMSSFPSLPSLVGMRFTFPPNEQDQAVYNVRVESFSQDNRSLFLENVGTFGRPVKADEVSKLAERFGATYAFLQDHVINFVEQFDGEEG